MNTTTTKAAKTKEQKPTSVGIGMNAELFTPFIILFQNLKKSIITELLLPSVFCESDGC